MNPFREALRRGPVLQTDPSSVDRSREESRSTTTAAPKGYKETFARGIVDAVSSAIAHGAKGDIDVRAAALAILFPEARWPPSPTPPSWQRQLWMDEDLRNHIAEVAPQPDDIPPSLRHRAPIKGTSEDP